MAVGQVILADVSLVEAQFAYEPHIVGDGSKIDFVVTKANKEILYIEVKTIHQKTRDSEVNWQKYQDRRKNHTENTDFIVYKNWLGSEIYGESFSSWSKFMEYTIEFERKLEAAVKAKKGQGILIFCGTGGKWRLDELEDFTDFYHSGIHRQDDTFAKMEANWIASKGVQLKRNISAFAYVKRSMECISAETWQFDVRGPREFHA